MTLPTCLFPRSPSHLLREIGPFEEERRKQEGGKLPSQGQLHSWRENLFLINTLSQGLEWGDVPFRLPTGTRGERHAGRSLQELLGTDGMGWWEGQRLREEWGQLRGGEQWGYLCGCWGRPSPRITGP